MVLLNDKGENKIITKPIIWFLAVFAFTFFIIGSAQAAVNAPSAAATSTVAVSSIGITWTWGGGTEADYVVEKSTNGTTFSVVSSSIATTTLSYSFTGLSVNTRYWFRVAATDGAGATSTYSTTSPAYTLANAPTSASTVQDSTTQITVSWSENSNPNGTNYYVSDVSGNTGWITATTSARSSLTCSHTYTFTIKAKNGDGVETSAITATNNTATCSSAGGESAAPPMIDTTPPSSCLISISHNATSTDSPIVLLSLSASDASSMMISNSADFVGAYWEDYRTEKNGH